MTEQEENMELLTEPMPEFYHKNQEVDIFKSNALIEGCYDLSPNELNLVNLVIEKSRKTNCGKLVTITAVEYANACKMDRKQSYEILKELAIRLKKRSFKATVYQNNIQTVFGEGDPYTVSRPKNLGKKRLKDVEVTLEASWVQALWYPKDNGFISFALSDPFHYLIQKTSEGYTKIPHSKSLELKRSYAKRLSELCYRWVGAKPLQGQGCVTVKKTVAEWYDFFGCSGKYKLTTEFKRCVLDTAISEVNQQGIFETSYRQIKVGRAIREIELRIKPKKDSQKSTTKTEPTPKNDQEQAVLDSANAYAEQINANPKHRENIQQKALRDHRQAEQAQKDEQKRIEQEQAKQQELEQTMIARMQADFNLICTDIGLIGQFYKDNERHLGATKVLAEGYFKEDGHKAFEHYFGRYFEDVILYQQLDLNFLQPPTSSQSNRSFVANHVPAPIDSGLTNEDCVYYEEIYDRLKAQNDIKSQIAFLEKQLADLKKSIK